MLSTMCSLENLQVKVLSLVVVVITWPNVFMCINCFVNSNNLLKRIHLKNLDGVFSYEIVAFFQILLVYMLAILLGDDLIRTIVINYLYSASILCRF